MNSGLKEFIKQSNNKIKNENEKINDLHKQINEYEAVIDVISISSGDRNMISNYREKINNCYRKIDLALENIRHNRDVIATMKVVEKIVKKNK